MTSSKRIAVYSGTFDPFTLGHLDVVHRAAGLFDQLVVAVAVAHHKKTLFNWLGQDLTGWRCADVFAGTGVLGFEAASRGALEVLVCEQDAVLADKLKALQVKLKASMVKVERGDGVSLLRRLSSGSMQLVFLDPPYESNVFEPALRAAAQVIGVPGFVYLEAPKPWTDEALEGFGLKVFRFGKAGAVHFHLLVKTAPQSAESA